MQTALSLGCDPIPARATGLIQVDLDCVVHNYRVMQAKTHAMTQIAPVLKANAYALGLKETAYILNREGVSSFFVATLEEAIALRSVSPKSNIFVLGGYMPGTALEYLEYQLTPVLISPSQIQNWIALQHQENKKLSAVLHLDTGMNRTGITEKEFPAIHSLLDSLSLRFVMSHYVSSECFEEGTTPHQFKFFMKYMAFFPGVPFSLANSHGLLWPKAYHGHWVRPGIALGGMCDTILGLKPALKVYGRVMQIKCVPEGQGIGYNRTYVSQEPKRIATVALGYADGLLRLASNRGVFKFRDFYAPIVGRVSMDFVTVDVSHIPEAVLHEGDWIAYFNDEDSIESMAKACGTNVYELLTSLQGRYYRQYFGINERVL